MDEDTTTSSASPTTTKISVYLPLVYVAVIISAFVLFSSAYRKKKINKLTSLRPWFTTPNHAKNIYLALKGTTPRPPPKLLKASLLQRGAEAVRRLMKLRKDQNAIKELYQKGLVGEDLWNRYQAALALEELELREISAEAEALEKGWSASFAAAAQEVLMNEALRRRLDELPERKNAVLKLWGQSVEE